MINFIKKIFLNFIKISIFFILFIYFSIFCLSDEVYKFDLQKLINYALNNNIEIKNIDLDIKKAEYDLLIAKAKKYPSISLTVSMSYLSNPIGPISINAGQFGSFLYSGGEILIPPQDTIIYKGMEKTLYQFKLIIDQAIFTWGKIDNSIKIYELLVESAKLKKLEKINEVKTKIKSYYHLIYLMDKVLFYFDEQGKLIERIINLSKKNYENGFITYSEFLQILINQKEFEYNYVKIRNEREKILLELKSVLNYDKDLNIIIDFTELDRKFNINDIESFFYKLPENYKILSIQNSLQLKQLEIFKKIVQLQYEIIKSSSYFKPDLGLRVEISYNGPRIPLVEIGWYTSNDFNITISLGISMLIYDAGTLDYKIKQARNEIEKVIGQLEYSNQYIINFLESLIYKLEINKMKIYYYFSKIIADIELIKSKEFAFQQGELNEIDFLKYKMALCLDNISFYLELMDYYLNYFNLEAFLYIEN
ncbi:MAG: TolC family protein [Spirochaetes bacterium]|nr:TolC family protein [Spirochaetota bacterium]